MPEIKIEHGLNAKQLAELNKVKAVFEKNWKPFAVGFVAGVTYLATR